MCTLDVKEATIHKKLKRTKSSSASATKSPISQSAATPSSSSSSSVTSSSAAYLSATRLSTATTGHKSGLKWKIIISSIIFLICRISHVLAIRKGRLMSPSSFIALSGDLHVQIQFNAEELGYDEMKTTTTSTTTTSRTVLGKFENATTTGNIENIITTTLVISKYVDDIVPSSTSPLATAVQHDGVTHHALEVDAVAHHGANGSLNDVVSSVPDEVNSTNLKNAGRVKQNSTETTNSTQSVVPNSPPVWYLLNTLNSTDKLHGHDEPILQRKRKEIIQNIPLYPDPRHNVTQIAVPCQTFVQGGLYEMQVVTNMKTTAPLPPQQVGNNTVTSKSPRGGGGGGAIPTITTTTLMPASDERLRQTLDVRWPAAEMRVSPVRLKTYPEKPVEVELRFPEVNCDKAWLSSNLPEFWLELIYCGKDRTCAQHMPANLTKSSILYAEQVRGYPKQKRLQLKCHLFGLAGHYAVQLRPMVPMPHLPLTRRFLSVDWSDKFVFNVYARSIFPCDPHTGIGVLYEYPACILDQGDRVRVYAKLRADVASLKPPTSLHYVAEQRVVKSQYSLYFNCDLFSEKYVEYCFVYVSQAISGAVADVRVDCVPTLPVKDSDTGGWGPWSEWTPCSTNCLGGTRNRYRFCDSPPPRYGAKFCDGPSVETEKCGNIVTDTWDCIYESSGVNNWANNRTAVTQEIGPGCRCGCIVHLGASKPKRIIAGATQSCPGRSFWLVQVDGQETIGLRLNFLRLPCANQYIKVRDGPSLSSTLLIELKGGNNLNSPTSTTELLESTGAQLLVEFYAGDVVGTTTTQKPTDDGSANGIEEQSPSGNSTDSGVGINVGCTGGFLANVEQFAEKNSSTLLVAATTRLSSVRSRAVAPKPRLRSGFTLVHLSAVIFASIIIVISALLGAQYVIRYRKYHLAMAHRRDHGSRLHTPRTSMGSLHQPPSRAMSTTTLISEVIYLVKMRPKHQLRHSILRESIDAEALARETEFASEADSEAMAQLGKCDEELGSCGSVVTLRNEPHRSIHSADKSVSPTQLSRTEHHMTTSHSSPAGTLTRKQSGDSRDSESIISSGMSSICHSPPPPLHGKRISRYSERYDAVTLKLRNSRFYDSAQDSDSMRSSCMRDYERLNQLALAGRSASASLTNGCYSPAASVVSTATIRTTTATNQKESKEKQNRKKLLDRPGSEFSLGNQEELEMDYYDYNVTNAGAAPGSYLGMDPAYLIWIPPFDDVPDALVIDEQDDEKTPEPADADAERLPLYEEIKMPRYGHYLSPGSNTETPTTNTATSSTCDELSPLSSQEQSKASSPSETNLKNSLIQKAINYVTASNKSHNSTPNSSKPSTPYVTRRQRRAAKKQQSKSTLSLGNVAHAQDAIAMSELCATKSARSIAAVHHTSSAAATASPDESDSYVEKETAVVKSPSDLQEFLALDDIQFADESESDHDAVTSAAKERANAQKTPKAEAAILPILHKSRRRSHVSNISEVEV